MEQQEEILEVDSERAETVTVFLNGRPLRYYVRACPGRPGWVDVVDVAAVYAHIEGNGPQINDTIPFEDFPTKRLTGEVIFKSK